MKKKFAIYLLKLELWFKKLKNNDQIFSKKKSKHYKNIYCYFYTYTIQIFNIIFLIKNCVHFFDNIFIKLSI